MKKIKIAARTSFALALLAVVCFCNLYPSCSVSTASISDAKICSQIGSDGACGNDATSFSVSTPVIYFTATLKNAPADTKITFEWKHNGESMGKADVTTGSGIINSTFKSPGTLDPGKYSCTAKINVDNSDAVTKEFTVVESTP